MSAQIILDIEKTKDPYSGLGQFCHHLAQSILENKEALEIELYGPAESDSKYKVSKFHRMFSFLLPKSNVWHCMHQDAPYVPNTGKVVLTIHDFNQLYKEKSESFKSSYIAKLQSKVDRADKIVFISDFVKEEAKKFLKLDENKCARIYNGVAKNKATKKPSITLPKRFLFSISTIMEKKNFHSLLPMMKERTDDLCLVIAGRKNNKYAQGLEDQIKEMGLQDKVLLIGTIDEDEKFWLYENCEAFIFPSLFEGFGIPVAEAMNFGKPLFLSKSTSVPEVGGDVAFYFDEFEASHMNNIIDSGLSSFDEEKANTIRERAKLFDWTQAAKAYLEIYKELL